MKKILCVLLTAVLLFAVHGCSQGKGKTNPDPVNIFIDSGYMGFFDGEWHSYYPSDEFGTDEYITTSWEELYQKYKTSAPYFAYGVDTALGIVNGWYMDEAPDCRLSYDVEGVVLATDIDIDPLPKRPVSYNSQATPEDLEVVNQWLLENDLDVDANINTVIQGDLDGDGTTERVIIANTRRVEESHEPADLSLEEAQQPGKGIYSAAFLVKDGVAQELFSMIRTKDDGIAGTTDPGEPFWTSDAYISIKSIAVYDLNQDGSYEVVLQYQDWDCPQLAAYTFQNSKLVPVLCMNLTW